MHLFIRELETAQELIESCSVLTIKHKLPYWLAFLAFLHGWALVDQGQIDDGLAEMDKGLQDLRIGGARDSLLLYLSQMAMANAQAGMVAEGFETPDLKESQRLLEELNFE